MQWGSVIQYGQWLEKGSNEGERAMYRLGNRLCEKGGLKLLKEGGRVVSQGTAGSCRQLVRT